MKIANVSYSQWKALVGSKKLLPQYIETPINYTLFAVEAAVSWEILLLKDSGTDVTDFEANIKPTANQPLEYRSSDGLQKVASAKFSDVKNLWLDGSEACVTILAGQTSYMRKHFAFEFTLSGVDCRWYSCNFGDYIDFELGFYTDTNDETSFIAIGQFSNHYMIYADGSRLFDVPSVRVLPEKIPGTNFDLYIRAKCVNTGANDSKVILNIVGWR